MRVFLAFPSLFLFGLVVFSDDTPKSSSSSEKILEVHDFTSITNDYRDNPIAAAKQYEKKKVSIYFYAGAAEKVDRRKSGFWLMEDFGTKVEGAVYRGPVLAGGTLTPIYVIEYQLSKEGEQQYAKMTTEERKKMKLVGIVHGTRSLPENVTNGLIVQVVDCSFVRKSDEDLKKDAERAANSKGGTPRKKKASSTRKQTEAEKAAEQARLQKEYRAAIEDAKAKRVYRGAMSLLDRGFPKEAKKQLQSIIDKYPDTPTAEQAKRQLAKAEK